VTEAHQDLLASLDVLNELGDVLDITNLVEHAKHGLVGATVARSVKSGHCTGE